MIYQQRIIAISGSLRAASRNTALLQAARELAPAQMQIELYDGLALIPPFNPDLNPDDIAAVAELAQAVRRADGVLIASPEYAHGVSGVMKNALDWLVGSDALVHKPLAMFNAAPRASHSYAALQETLQLMSVRWPPASLPHNRCETPSAPGCRGF